MRRLLAAATEGRGVMNELSQEEQEITIEALLAFARREERHSWRLTVGHYKRRRERRANAAYGLASRLGAGIGAIENDKVS